MTGDERMASNTQPALAALVGFILVATLLPFAAIPLPVLGQIGVPIILLVAFHGCWLAGGKDDVRIDRGLLAALGVFVALIVVAFGLGVWTYGYTREAGVSAANLGLSALLVLGVLQAIRTPSQLELLLRVFLIAASLSALLGLVLWALPAPLAEVALVKLVPLGYPDGPEIIRLVYGTQLERATGTSVDANLFGGLMMLAATILAGQLLAEDRLLPRPTLLVSSLVVFAALALSFSRSAWVGAGVGIFYLGLFVDRRALLAIALAGVLVLAVPQMRDRLAGAILVQDAASVMRVGEYTDTVHVVVNHVWFGVGFGPAFGLDLVRRVSNMYLLIAEEMGMVGACSLAILLAATLRRGSVILPLTQSQRSRLRGRGGEVLACLQAAFVASLVAGLFDHYFMNGLFPHTTGLFWLMAGLLLVAARLAAMRLQHPSIEREGRGGDRGPGEARDEGAAVLA